MSHINADLASRNIAILFNWHSFLFEDRRTELPHRYRSCPSARAATRRSAHLVAS